jgi:DNA-binding transcriptional LysR family regulator
MRALPVDVVRALVAIVDCRGFTRAAESLGRTQPTISLQIRRLEELIGGPVFDNTTRLSLSRQGRTVLDYGRKLVAAHDELVDALKRQERGDEAVRLGMPSEFASVLAPSLVDLASGRGESFTFEVTCDQSEALIERVRAHQLDMALAMTLGEAVEGAVASWTLRLSWCAAPRQAVPPDAPVRLVTPPEGTLFHRIAVEALTRAGRKFEIVCKSANPDVLRSAVDAGYGVTLALTALAPNGARLVSQALLAPLPEVTLALYARDGARADADAPLVAHMIDLLQASPAFASAAQPQNSRACGVQAPTPLATMCEMTAQM